MSLAKKGKTYFAVIRIDGRQRWIRCGTRKREAQRKHDELLADALRGALKAPNPITFSEFADEFLSGYCDVMLKSSTRKEYGIYLERHLKPYFGDKRLESITQRDVQAYVSSKTKPGGLSPKSVSNHLVVLKRLFSVAVEWQVLETSPAAKVPKPRVPRPEIKFLEPSEVRALIAATPEKDRLLVASACMLGARKGEILALKWDCVSLESRTITIRRSLYAGELHEPKSVRSVRVLPLSASLHQMYAAAATKDHRPDDFVFHSASGGPLGNGTPNRILRKALEDAGIDKSVTFHSLRHSFVAMAIEARVPLKVIQELAGHASIGVTMDRYGHLLAGAQGAAIQAISDLIYAPEDDATDPPSDGSVTENDTSC